MLKTASITEIITPILGQSHPHSKSNSMWSNAHTILNNIIHYMSSNMDTDMNDIGDTAQSLLYTICEFNKLNIVSTSPSAFRIDGLYDMLLHSNIYINKNIGNIDNRGNICASCLAALYAICMQLDRSNYISLNKKSTLLNYWAKQDIQTGEYIHLYILCTYIQM